MNAEWIMEWWRQEKIDDDLAVREIVRWKCRGAERKVAEMKWLIATKEDFQDKDEQFQVRKDLEKAFKKFKTYPAIEAWKQGHDKKYWGKVGRFPFLVLEGESKLGKTQLALSLYGANATYVTNCQSCEVPQLVGFNRHQKAAIIFDEASYTMCHSQKAMFQANADGAETGFSKTNVHHKWHWLYGVPLIVCTNNWAKEGCPEWDWLKANCVHVKITGSTFEGGDVPMSSTPEPATTGQE